MANRTKNVVDEPSEDGQAETVVFSQPAEKDPIREKNEALIMDIVKQTNGSLCNLDEVVAKLVYVDKKQRRRMPWNCDLTFGTTLTIKIAAYIYVRCISFLIFFWISCKNKSKLILMGISKGRRQKWLGNVENTHRNRWIVQGTDRALSQWHKAWPSHGGHRAGKRVCRFLFFD